MHKSLLPVMAFGASLASAYPAFADAETEALRAQVKALEARLDQLEKREKTQQKVVAAPAVVSKAPASVDKRLAIVERNQEVAQEEAKAKALTTPKIEYNPGKGLTIAAPDRQYSVRMTGYIQADDRWFLDSGAAGTTNTFLLRSARPIVETKLTDYFDGRFQLDFGKGTTTLLDAYGDFHPLPGNNIVNVRAGEFKVPVGLERWQSESDVWFVERGQTTNLVPYRDIGLMVHGHLIPDQFEYQVAYINGGSDLQANTGDADNNKDVAARVMLHPLTWSGVQALSGIGIGFGGTYGVHQGTPTAPGLVTGYLTFGQRTFFAYKSSSTVPSTTVYANGGQWRLNPQLMYFNGPFGFYGEYVLNNQEVKVGTRVAKFTHKAWEGVASWVLTGEDSSFDGVKPNNDFDPRSGKWGAFELVGRASELNIDRNAFTGAFFADPATNSRSAFETTFGVNWYFSRAVKLNLDLSRTQFDGGAAGGRDHVDEKVVMSRAQFRF